MKDTSLASIIAPSKELEIKHEPIVLVSNLDGVEAYIDEITKPFFEGTIDVSTDDLETSARATLADLNKIIDAIDKKRIAEIREISAPITDLDKRAKGIVSKAKEAYRKAKDELDKKAEELRRIKRERLKAEYLGAVGEDVAKLIPFEKIEVSKWTTKGCTEAKAIDELLEKVTGIIEDIKTLNATEFNYPNQVMKHYYDNLSLRDALQEDARLVAAKEEADRVAKETQEALRLAPKPVPVEKPVAQEPKPAVDHDLSDYALIVRGISVFDAQDIAKYAKQLTGKSPELKNKNWIERIGI